MRKIFLSLLFLAGTFYSSRAQQLKPGFDPVEYGDLLSLAFHSSSITDSSLRGKVHDPYKMIYRSAEVGLLNRWTLYMRDDKVACIDLRGTVNKLASWMGNFYSAMIPATGTLELNDSTKFDYKFANYPGAMVHVGWAIGVAYLGPDVERHINDLYKNAGTREFLLFGHSLGGALSFLMRSWLEYEKQAGRIPADVIIKAYSSAGPKPGNLYYAYDYDFITRNGWGFNVVNAADWVPESPFSIQTIAEFNRTNPFIHIKDILKKQSFITRLAIGHVFRKMDKSTRKAQKKFEKYLGEMIYKRGIKKTIPGLKEPHYTDGSNFMRAGTPVILMPDEDYYKRFPNSDTNFFIHHLYPAYSYLLNKWYPRSGH